MEKAISFLSEVVRFVIFLFAGIVGYFIIQYVTPGAGDISNIPFSQLTLGKITSNLINVGLTIFLFFKLTTAFFTSKEDREFSEDDWFSALLVLLVIFFLAYTYLF